MSAKHTVTVHLQLVQVTHAGLHASSKLSSNNTIWYVSATDTQTDRQTHSFQ